MKYQRRIVRIGNSSGIVLPKTIMKLAELEDAFYLNAEIGKGKITLTKTTKLQNTSKKS